MSNRKAPNLPALPETPRAPTFDLNDPALQAIIAQAVAVAVAAKEAEKPAGRSKTEENIWKTKKAFAKAGYKNVEPNVNVLTFNKWMAAGRRVKEGERSTKVANLRLFHLDQTRPATKQEVAEHAAKLAPLEASRAADKLPKVSPITPAPAPKGKTRKIVPINPQPSA